MNDIWSKVIKFGAIILVLGGFYEALSTLEPGLIDQVFQPSEEQTAEADSQNPAHDDTPAPPPAGPTDPYAPGQRALAQTGYAAQKAQLMQEFTQLNWAVRCRVIMPVDASVISMMARRQIERFMNAPDPTLEPDIGVAGRNGIALAQSQGCNYWLRNPEAVAAIREQARIAGLQ